jgi:hypothetical protein
LSSAPRDHRFVPAELTAPANTPITIVVGNQGPAPTELEIRSPRVEKIVAGGAKSSVQIRASAPGRCRFFDDYHEDTTEGVLVAKSGRGRMICANESAERAAE